MKKSLTTLVCALLAGCAAPPSSQERPAAAAMTPQAQREMEMLESFLAGTFEMVAQDGSKMAAPVMLRHAPFWTDRPGEHWMYAEYVNPGEAKPFRQRIYKFVQGGIVTYRLPGEPSAFAGEWRKERPFAARPAGARGLPAHLLPAAGIALCRRHRRQSLPRRLTRRGLRALGVLPELILDPRLGPGVRCRGTAADRHRRAERVPQDRRPRPIAPPVRPGQG